jgi:hypothetical protein
MDTQEIKMEINRLRQQLPATGFRAMKNNANTRFQGMKNDVQAFGLKRKSMIKRIFSTIPELIITLGCLAGIIILMGLKKEDIDKEKQFKQIQTISIVLVVTGVIYLGYSSTRMGPGTVSGMLVASQTFPLFATLGASFNEDEDFDESIKKLMVPFIIALLIQSMMRLKFVTCTVV